MTIVAESTRLQLKTFSQQDADGFYHLNNDPLVIQYTGDTAFASVDATSHFISHYRHYQSYGFGRWSVYLNHSQYVGFCGLRYSPNTKEVDLGFRLLREYWNQGIATEAAQLALALGFRKYHLKSIIAKAMEANLASIQVLKKLGFNFEKCLEQGPSKWKQYRLTRSQFVHRHDRST